MKLYGGGMKLFGIRRVAVVLALILSAAELAAHEMIVQGTVAAIETGRIQVKTGKEGLGEPATWYPIDGKTRIKRGKKTVTFSEAAITVDERVVVIVDHPDKGPMKTKEIRLAER